MLHKYKNSNKLVRFKSDSKALPIGGTPKDLSLNGFGLRNVGDMPEKNKSFSTKKVEFEKNIRLNLKNELQKDYSDMELVDPDNPDHPDNAKVLTFIEARDYEFEDEKKANQSKLAELKGTIVDTPKGFRSGLHR